MATRSSIYQPSPSASNPEGLRVAATVEEFNGVQLCQLGQDLVHEITQRTFEMCQTMKQLKLPGGTNNLTLGHYQEKKNKLDEQLQNIKDCFRRLRDAYTKVEVNSIEESLPPAQLTLHIEGEQWNNDNVAMNDEWREAMEENRDLIEQVRLKNHHVKEVIDRLRSVLWDVNGMLAMKRVTGDHTLSSAANVNAKT